MPDPRGREYGPRYIREFELSVGTVQFEIKPHWVVSRRSHPVPSTVKLYGHDAVRKGYVVDGFPPAMTPNRTGLKVFPGLKMAKASCERFVKECWAGERNSKTGEPL